MIFILVFMASLITTLGFRKSWLKFTSTEYNLVQSIVSCSRRRQVQTVGSIDRAYPRRYSLNRLSMAKYFYNDNPRNPLDSFLHHLDIALNNNDPTNRLLQLSLYDRKFRTRRLNDEDDESDTSKILIGVYGRLVKLKSGLHLQLTYRFQTNDQAKNFPIMSNNNQYIDEVKSLIEKYNFCKGTVKTVTSVWELNLRGNGKIQQHMNSASPLLANLPSSFSDEMTETSPVKTKREKLLSVAKIDGMTRISNQTLPEVESQSNSKIVTAEQSNSYVDALQHNRVKRSHIDINEPFLRSLKIVTSEGKIYTGMTDKYRQIQKFLDIIDNMRRTLEMDKKDFDVFRVFDMGCGLGYLTFAIHSYLSRYMPRVETIGVENRLSLVQKTQNLAQSLGSVFDNLKFELGSINDYDTHSKPMNMLVALHACDTATDDAIFCGINAKADIIIVSPCCQKEIRRQIETSYQNDYNGMSTRHDMMTYGIYRERQSEMITDTLRALILEWSGYDTNIMEFISGEHTLKNIMITAIKKSRNLEKDQSIHADKRKKIEENIRDICTRYGIQSMSLATKLGLVLQIQEKV